MKQIVVISGKGGTGKTTVASSFAYLAENVNIADCDVEAPNLNLMLENKTLSKRPYFGGKNAYIEKEKCNACGKCIEVCRFGAVKKDYTINDLKCEGCGACSIVCQVKAIRFEDEETGQIINGKTEKGVFVHSELKIGADGAGKIVTEIRKELVKEKDNKLSIIDGSPGIGCVVIASITGCDMAVIVTEPTQSGMDDLKRVLNLTYHFDIDSYVIINKYDINKEKAKEIETFCEENQVNILGQIPFDPFVNIAIQESRPIVDFTDSEGGKTIREIWNKLYKKIGGNCNENSISN